MQSKNSSRLIGASLVLGALALPALAQTNATTTGVPAMADMSDMMYGSYATGLSSADTQALTQALGGLSLSDQVMLREKMYELLPSQNRVLLQALSAPGAIQGGKVQWSAIATATMPTMTMPGGPALTGIMEPVHAPMSKMPPMDMSSGSMAAGAMTSGTMANTAKNSGSKRRRRRHGKQQSDTTQTDTMQGGAISGGTTGTSTPTTPTPPAGGSQ